MKPTRRKHARRHQSG